MFKDKADDIYAKGVERRGQFNPDPGSAHLKAYLWWVENSQLGEKPKRENFCHYWRVVLFWTPLIWLGFQAIAAVEWVLDRLPKRKANFDKKPSFYRRHKSTIDSVGMSVLLAWCAIMVIVILVMSAIAFWKNPVGGLMILGIIVAVSAFVSGMVFIIGRITERAKVKDAARRQEFLDGKITLDEYLGNKEKKAPGKIAKFFNGVGDFCHLIFQVVRVKKWKICPFVEIPDA